MVQTPVKTEQAAKAFRPREGKSPLQYYKTRTALNIDDDPLETSGLDT